MSSQQADVESAFASPPGSVDAHPPTSPPRVDNGGPPATFAEPPSSAVVLDAKHVVADGDTLGLIGEMYQTPVRVIQRLNDLHPDSIIYPGETLRVPTQLQSTTHVVVPGETLVSIARRFDAPVDHVKALNGLAGDDVIHPGRELRVLRGTNAIIARREREQASEELSESDATAMMPTAATRPPREERDDERDAERDAELDAAPTRVPSRGSRGSRGLSAVALFPARLLNATVDATLRVASELTSSLGWRLIRLPSGAETNQPSLNRGDQKPSRVSARPGESLASVAASHGLRIRELQRANGITSDALDVGQSLRVTRLSFSERAPRLRRRTRRHLFERDAENDATRDVDRAWRRWRWRYEPRGEEAREFFSRRAGVGRSDSNVTERSDKVNEAIRASSSGERPRVCMTWEDRRPRRSSTKWHPKFAAPVKKTHDAFITSGFGWRWGRLHAGVDLAANEGTPIRVSAGGTVAERVFDAGGYGWLLRVAHGDGWETRYAHCREIDKRLVVGKKVRRGQKVAEVGNTGRSFGPHLHFEVRRNGVPVDPLTCSDA
jgi:murein DD-endopeptidase MepM/ murein hydrolase activator NlpD